MQPSGCYLVSQRVSADSLPCLLRWCLSSFSSLFCVNHFCSSINGSILWQILAWFSAPRCNMSWDLELFSSHLQVSNIPNTYCSISNKGLKVGRFTFDQCFVLWGNFPLIPGIRIKKIAENVAKPLHISILTRTHRGLVNFAVVLKFLQLMRHCGKENVL